MDERLQVRCPAGGEVLWQVFSGLQRPISQQEIAAWQHNHGTRLSGWEIDMLLGLDHIASQVAAQHHKAKPP